MLLPDGHAAAHEGGAPGNVVSGSLPSELPNGSGGFVATPFKAADAIAVQAQPSFFSFGGTSTTVALSEASGLCSSAVAGGTPALTRTIFFALASIGADGTVSPATQQGSYIVDSLSYGIDTNPVASVPAANSFAAEVVLIATTCDQERQTPASNYPAVSGTIVLQRPDTVPDMGSNVSATFDVTFANGDQITGSFDALACSFVPNTFVQGVNCGCVDVGKPCDANGDCCGYSAPGLGGASTAKCVANAAATGAYGYCEPTNPPNVDGGGYCGNATNGIGCEIPSDCCVGYYCGASGCVAWGADAGTAPDGGRCDPAGGSCNQQSDCCPGAICDLDSNTCNACGNPTNGVTCVQTSDCCSGYVCGSSDTCITCLQTNSECTYSQDCCSGTCNTISQQCE